MKKVTDKTQKYKEPSRLVPIPDMCVCHDEMVGLLKESTSIFEFFLRGEHESVDSFAADNQARLWAWKAACHIHVLLFLELWKKYDRPLNFDVIKSIVTDDPYQPKNIGLACEYLKVYCEYLRKHFNSFKPTPKQLDLRRKFAAQKLKGKR